MDKSGFSREIKNQSAQDLSFFEQTSGYFEAGSDSTLDKIENFAKYIPRQTLAKLLARYEIFNKILSVNGSIVECGVLRGGGLFTFAKLSSIFEPVNHTRKVIGFDTFEGFPSIHEKDRQGTSSHLQEGGLSADVYEELHQGVELYDANRAVGHIPKIELVKGDIKETAPKYLEDNPHLVVSLLYLDVDLYEPTKVALECFLDRMPKGGIICFDELNAKMFPGETTAVQEVIGLNNLRIERFPFDSYLSYAVL
ncbi:hypothetical protein BH20ACT11_BH20ACT11_00230 [soil metagenome]|jgi:hypothetical protein